MPGVGDYAVLDPDEGISFAGGTNSFNCFNLYRGTMTVSAGLFQANAASYWDSQVGRTSGETATLNQTGGEVRLEFLEIGRASGAAGVYNLSGGVFKQTGISRASGYGLFLGRQDSGGQTGAAGLFEVSGGSVLTRLGVMLGDEEDTDGVGTFSVQGSGIEAISIGGYTNETVTGAGTWYQYARNTVKFGIDAGGVTPIEVTGGDIFFAYGSTVDVSFIEGHLETNRWTVMTTDGTITDEGLYLAADVDSDLWNFGVTNGSELWVSYGMGGWEAPTVPPRTDGVYAWPTSPSEVTLGWDENAAAVSYTIKRSSASGGTYETIASGITELSYVDDTVLSNSTYYYVVSAVNDSGEGQDSDEYRAVVIPYTIIGTDDVWDAADPTQYKYSLFDDDVDTYFDGQGSDAWAGLDFGEGNAQQVVTVRYVLRNDSNSWKGNINAQIQGANSADFSDAVTLYTLGSNSVTYSEVNTVEITDTASYRYVRLTAGNRNAVNFMSEIDFILPSDFTSNGTPQYWLDDYELVTDDDYDAADISDSDDDGLMAWEEYAAGTDPTDDMSVLEINSISNAADGVVITWQSVSNKTYSIFTNTSLSVASPGTAVSGITAVSNVTSYTLSGSADRVFYEIGVE